VGGGGVSTVGSRCVATSESAEDLVPAVVNCKDYESARIITFSQKL
jgi:hypothetical protein